MIDWYNHWLDTWHLELLPQWFLREDVLSFITLGALRSRVSKHKSSLSCTQSRRGKFTGNLLHREPSPHTAWANQRHHRQDGSEGEDDGKMTGSFGTTREEDDRGARPGLWEALGVKQQKPGVEFTTYSHAGGCHEGREWCSLPGLLVLSYI